MGIPMYIIIVTMNHIHVYYNTYINVYVQDNVNTNVHYLSYNESHTYI